MVRDYSDREDYGGGGGSDPFEAFPDAVLVLIVSKLPFRSAVAASAISRAVAQRCRRCAHAGPRLRHGVPRRAAPCRRAAFAAAVSTALGPSPLRRTRTPSWTRAVERGWFGIGSAQGMRRKFGPGWASIRFGALCGLVNGHSSVKYFKSNH